MRFKLLAAALIASAGLTVVAGGASAQAPTTDDSNGDYSSPGINYGVKGYYFTDSYRGPRVYGYTSYGDDDLPPPPRLRRYDLDDRDGEPRLRGGCGTYRYWDGDTCVDARDRR